MKMRSYIVLVGVFVLMSQSIGLFAGSDRRFSIWRKSDPTLIVEDAARKWNVISEDMDILYAAAQRGSYILDFVHNPQIFSRQYPSNVLRAARDVAEKTQGESSKVYGILNRVLSYK